ncbi:MAG: hypothetical protein HPY52_11945 [Firmicutes bacterium]|nr:hypothetical protein [Bacillota bacterium]
MTGEIERSISAIPSVRSCKVVFNADKEIDQVFVWAGFEPGLDEKAKLRQIKSLVRSVVGTVALKHNHELDYRKVKILEYEEHGSGDSEDSAASTEGPDFLVNLGNGACTGEDTASIPGSGDATEDMAKNEQGTPPPDGIVMVKVRPRIKLVAAYIRYHTVPEVVVEFRYLGKDFSGKAPVEDKLDDSTFEAFKQAFEATGLGKVKLIHIAEVSLALSQPKVVLVKLLLTLPNNEKFELVGAAEEKGDRILSVVKACLDAINRKVTNPV